MKKWFKIIMVTVGVTLIAMGYITYNIKSYSVYYAKHTPHKEGVEPVLMTLIDELWWIPQINTPKYRYKDNDDISIMENGEQKYLYYSSYSVVNERWEYSYSGIMEKRISYIFDETFRLVTVWDMNNLEKLDINTFNEKQIKQEMYSIYKELIDFQPIPSINLQWLFDWLYHDKFN